MNMHAENPLIIIGMHRSGTTMLTRLLRTAGANLGSNLGPNFEDPFFQDANRHLLDMAGSHWARPQPFLEHLQQPGFRAEAVDRTAHLLQNREIPAGIWGWKDPRTTLTLPIWLAHFPGGRVVHLVRNGLDVSLSLFRREIRRYLRPSKDRRVFPPTFSACFGLWQIYVATGRNAARLGTPYLELKYEDFLHTPVESLKTVSRFAGIDQAVDFERLAGMIGKPTQHSGSMRLLARAAWKTSIRDKRLMHTLGYTIDF